jgi:hypothetical protein
METRDFLGIQSDDTLMKKTSSNSINNILFYGNSAMEFHRVINK